MSLSRLSLGLAATLVISVAAQVAPAASIQLSTGLTAGNRHYVAFTLIPGADQGNFDTIDVTITATSGAFLADADSGPSLNNEGDDETSFSISLLIAGLTQFGYTESTTELSATFSSLGGNTISDVDRFLGQVVYDAPNSGGVIDITLKDGGIVIGNPTETFGVPEPASLALLAIGGLLMVRGKPAR